MSSKRERKQRRRDEKRARKERESQQNAPATQPLFPAAPIIGIQQIADRENIADHTAKQNRWQYPLRWPRLSWLLNPSRRSILIGELLFAGLIALFTGLQVYYGTKLWDAAEVSNELSRDTAKKQLRAYVTTAGWLAQQLPNDEVAYTVHLKNSGVTMANDVVINSDISIEDRRFNGPFDFSGLAPGRHISTSVFGPEHTGMHTKSLTITAEDRVAIKKGDKAIWFYGEVRYVDVFKEPHRTKFRFIAGGRAGTAFDEMVFAQEGNEAD